jgi:hypothetical protein
MVNELDPLSVKKWMKSIHDDVGDGVGQCLCP